MHPEAGYTGLSQQSDKRPAFTFYGIELCALGEARMVSIRMGISIGVRNGWLNTDALAMDDGEEMAVLHEVRNRPCELPAIVLLIRGPPGNPNNEPHFAEFGSG